MSCSTTTGRIRTTQDKLTITLDTCLDISTGVTRRHIDYKDPNGVTGSWVAALSGTQEITYTLADDEFLDVEGLWSVKARVEYADGTTASGTVETFTVYGEWD